MRFAGRSSRELAFRLQQVLRNAALWLAPPKLPRETESVELALPGPARLREDFSDPAFKTDLLMLADEITRHRFPLFDSTVETGPKIDWRRDYLNGKTSGTDYFRFIPYLDFEKVGDHKNIWELNRHQHLVLLAQAYLLTDDEKYRTEIGEQLESWWDQNPFLGGINWTSALEVAFRAISWLWIDHLIGVALDGNLRQRLLTSLYEHGCFLECNLSVYFSPNTHLLGEAVALHAIGLKFHRESWRESGSQLVREQLARQVQPDGSHFEQSTYYHLYALDFFLFHYLLAGRPPEFEAILRKMARFLASIAGPERLLTCFGDDDGGRLFYPYGRRDRFARATLTTCALLFPEEDLPLAERDFSEQALWWIGRSLAPQAASRTETRLFRDSGLASITMAGGHILMDAGRFGYGGAGHSHADTLSITARSGERELLIDPGTFTYIADKKLRDAFRGTGFHNTIRIDGLDQADPAGPFRWDGKPDVEIHGWEADGRGAFLDASCVYRGFRHRRRLFAFAEGWVMVLDEVTGPAGEHRIDQFWHLGHADVKILFSEPKAVHPEPGLRSRVLGQKEAAPVLCASWNVPLPHLCGAAFSIVESGAGHRLERNGLELAIPGIATVTFAEQGNPVVSTP